MKRPSGRSRKRKPILTNDQLREWAKAHPVPSSFWDGDDDPSKPIKG